MVEKFLSWFRAPRKRYAKPMHVDFYIVLSGRHDVEIQGLEGVSLKEVERDTYDKHKGLKYWVSSDISGVNKGLGPLKALSIRTRIDVFDLIFGKKIGPFDGIDA